MLSLPFREPFAREKAMKTAVGQMADGRAVDVEPILYANKGVTEPESVYSDPVSSLEADEFLSSVPESKTGESLQAEIAAISKDLLRLAMAREVFVSDHCPLPMRGRDFFEQFIAHYIAGFPAAVARSFITSDLAVK